MREAQLDHIGTATAPGTTTAPGILMPNLTTVMTMPSGIIPQIAGKLGGPQKVAQMAHPAAAGTIILGAMIRSKDLHSTAPCQLPPPPVFRHRQKAAREGSQSLVIPFGDLFEVLGHQ